MEQYTDEQIHGMLMQLSVDEIKEVADLYKIAYPHNRHYQTLCSIALGIKFDTNQQQAFVDLIQKVKSAPDSAATPSQGNETRQPNKDRIHLYYSR